MSCHMASPAIMGVAISVAIMGALTAQCLSSDARYLHSFETTCKLYPQLTQTQCGWCLCFRFDEARRDRGQKFEGMNLYIKNLVDEVDDAELRSEFQSFGTITSAKVMRNQQGKSKGFGFVCYSSFEEATRAVTEMSGRMLHDKPLYVAMAQRSEQRKAQLQQRYQQPAGLMGPPMGPMGPMGPPMPGMNGPMPMYPGAMPPYMQGPGPRGMGPRGYPRGPPGPMMYPPMMPQVCLYIVGKSCKLLCAKLL